MTAAGSAEQALAETVARGMQARHECGTVYRTRQLHLRPDANS